MKTFLQLNQMFPKDMPKEVVVRIMAEQVAHELLKDPQFFQVVSAEQPASNAPYGRDYTAWSVCVSANIFSRE